ncbi:24777_t:CDS:1 [Cetraspora pellucida]|uniref:24777_t:CDS:1 n=1 Tax=Cetraspora pellucida TaxID=1433469 RepID=A0A9N9GT78_9GLOM|nr:24777_t:CDS:1 [Cetraspora pellucida]
MGFRAILCIIYRSCDIYYDHDRGDDGGNYRNSYKDYNRDKSTNNKNKDMNDHKNENNSTSVDENIPPHTTISSNLTPSIKPTLTSSSHSNLTSADNKPSISIESNPTSTPYSNLTDTQSTIGTKNSAEDTSSSTDANKITDPFDPKSPFHIPIIIGIVITVLIALLVSYCVLRKTVFKKRYNLSNKGYYSMDENEPGRTSSFDSNTEIQSPTIAMTSNRSSIVRIDQLINIDLGEGNISNYRNTSNAQDFMEPARRSSAFLDYPNDFYHAYTEPEITSENVEHETIQRPDATFNLRDSQN